MSYRTNRKYSVKGECVCVWGGGGREIVASVSTRFFFLSSFLLNGTIPLFIHSFEIVFLKQKNENVDPFRDTFGAVSD